MPRLAYKNCKGCGCSSAEVGELSWQRLCSTCGHERKDANNDQISAGHGPYALHRARRQIMAARRVLLDDQRQSA